MLQVITKVLNQVCLPTLQSQRYLITSASLLVKKRRIAPKATSKLNYIPEFPDVHAKVYPAKLHMVKRLRNPKPDKKRHKEILRQFDIFEYDSKPVIVKNTPKTNGLLWQIKHLIEIKPVTFPQGEPDIESIEVGEKGCILTDNGEFIVSEELKVDNLRFADTEDFERKILSGEILRNQLHKNFYKW